MYVSSLYRQALMLLLAVTLGALLPQPVEAKPTTRRGFAAHYGKGTMERVARKRGMSDRGCLVASPFEPLGTRVEVRSRRGVQSCLVVDIPQRRHRASIIRRGIVVELGWPSAQALCGLRYVREQPPSKCPVTVRRLR